MKGFVLAASMAAVMGTVAMPAAAQSYQEQQLQYERDRAVYRQQMREYRRANREYRRQNRNWRDYRRYDHDRVDPAYGDYYANRYYRDGRYYQERRLSANERIYRGQDGRYYCRRNDGTTGLIIGAGAGALLGNAIDNGRSSLLGTVLGAVAGGAIGREVDRNGNNDIRCR
jgi:type II secretory pathway pseudopilin PulG